MEVYLGENMKILEYDTNKYNFAELISGLFDIDLSDLDSKDQKTNLTLGMDTHTSFHKVFYDKLDGEGGWAEFDGAILMEAADTLSGLASAATAITYTIYGLEIS